jgi:hypothetical protein
MFQWEGRDEVLLLACEMEGDIAGLRVSRLPHLLEFEEREEFGRKVQGQKLMKRGMDGVHGSPSYGSLFPAPFAFPSSYCLFIIHFLPTFTG